MNITAFLTANIINGLLGVALLVLGYKAFDLLTPKWDFHKAFNNNDTVTNAGLVIAAFLIGLSLVIALTAG